jgi:phosphopantothenoylcysteine decarboxylase/phosphopantothenate--cysteine ligase
MGYALAAAAKRRGHEVLLISGPVTLPNPKGVETVQVISAAEMATAVKKQSRWADAAIMTAAVCDYRPRRKLTHKLKKQARPRPIVLEPTEDIAAWFGRQKGRRLLVCFAMEDHDHRKNALSKLQRKRCDAIVLNGPENVAADRAVIEILTPDGHWSPEISGTKKQLANRIVRLVEGLSVR